MAELPLLRVISAKLPQKTGPKTWLVIAWWDTSWEGLTPCQQSVKRVKSHEGNYNNVYLPNPILFIGFQIKMLEMGKLHYVNMA